jgi:hypothetical protein
MSIMPVACMRSPIGGKHFLDARRMMRVMCEQGFAPALRRGSRRPG